MTDTQLLTTSITLLGIFLAMMVNNHRISDMRDVLRSEMRADRAEANERFGRLESKIEKNHDVLLRLLADIDQRVGHLEDRSR